MQLIPSIDLRGGHCVRLFKGAFDAETRYDLDPALLLERYAALGARWLHVVDLDGARDGVLGNRELIARLAAAQRLKIQVGGGLRSLPVRRVIRACEHCDRHRREKRREVVFVHAVFRTRSARRLPA